MRSLHATTSSASISPSLLFPAIFLSTFLLAFVSGSLFLSVSDTSAESIPTDISVDVNSSLSITTDAAGGELIIPVSPVPSGALSYLDLEVDVSTNNLTGYTLSMNTKIENTALINQSNSSHTIPSTTYPKASPGTLTANTWGYHVWPLGQTTSSTTFSALPPLSAPQIITVTNAPSPSSITTLTFGVNVDTTLISGTYKNTVVFTATSNYVPTAPEIFQFTIDTRMTDTLDTDPAHYSGTATDFYIPTSGYVDAVFSHAYSWYINCGGPGHTDQLVGGAGANDSNGILCSYPAAGEYQITISSGGNPTMGWMNAFGFSIGSSGNANTQANKNMFKSIDSSLTNYMRTAGGTHRFARMFHGARNAATIPAGLFDKIDTSSATNLSNMFNNTFRIFAYNSTTATIPVGLFDKINTSGATDLNNMFYSTFSAFASNSPTATIPAGLFDTIDISGAINLRYMFHGTFEYFAYNSPTATIPAGLFDTINTGYAVEFMYMFCSTFNSFAYNSPTATIPAGLFDKIDTSGATNIDSMFYQTFYRFASANTLGGTADTDINIIWGNANLSGITALDANSAFGSTFYDMLSLTGAAQTFISSKLSFAHPNDNAYTFTGTNVTDLASLHANWK